MGYVIIKAQVGYIVYEDMGVRNGYQPVTKWVAFDSWEQASLWIGEQFKKKQ